MKFLLLSAAFLGLHLAVGAWALRTPGTPDATAATLSLGHPSEVDAVDEVDGALALSGSVFTPQVTPTASTLAPF